LVLGSPCSAMGWTHLLLALLASQVSGEMYKVSQCLMNAEETPGLLNCTEKMKEHGDILYSPNLPLSKQCAVCADCDFSNKDLISGVCPPDLPRSSHKPPSSNEKVGQIIDYANAPNLSGLQKLKKEGYNLSVGDYDKRTALHIAASEDHVEVVRFLLYEALVYPEPLDRWDHTPLSEARRLNKQASTKVLEDWLSCFTTGVHFVKGGSSDEVYQNIPTREDCRLLCQVTENCEFFNFLKGDCTVKSELGNRTEVKGGFFGHRTCQEQTESGLSLEVIGAIIGSVLGTILIVFLVFVILRCTKCSGECTMCKSCTDTSSSTGMSRPMNITTTETWTATPRVKSTTSNSYNDFDDHASNNTKPKNTYSQPGNTYSQPNKPTSPYGQPSQTYGNVKIRSNAPRAAPMSTGIKKGFVSLSTGPATSVDMYTTQEDEAETYYDSTGR